ncbi:MAG: hypothetical protein AVDCRST_MAG95-1196 [uncultured Adhaeribacter sp.]|uniref:Uncharacterized protein n=1 Tax=uncultured Adhaeribacter sp. TaxID=448109 RepID=A0A6J4HVV3_9BACT|nr:MAG: hypothetical protein AVDCRST_MAG95-1196 [uncultured Adhaeribacter sp.]
MLIKIKNRKCYRFSYARHPPELNATWPTNHSFSVEPGTKPAEQKGIF